MGFSSVSDFLVSQSRARPRTFEEICFHVDKSRGSCFCELNGLLSRFDVVVVRVWFNEREVPFYTVRRDVRVTRWQVPSDAVIIKKFLRSRDHGGR